MIINSSKVFVIPTGLPDTKSLNDIQEPAQGVTEADVVVEVVADDVSGVTPDTTDVAEGVTPDTTVTAPAPVKKASKKKS